MKSSMTHKKLRITVKNQNNKKEYSTMETAIVIGGVIRLTGIILKSIIHYRITSSLSNNQPGAEFVECAGDGVIEMLTGGLQNKVNKFFGKEKTMQEKLDNIVLNTFQQVNEKYNDKFTEFPNYLENKNIIIKTEQDMKVYIRMWNREKSSVCTITSDEISNFVKDFYNMISDSIDLDESLKVYLATLKTEEGVESIIAELNEIKQAIANNPASQNIDTNRIALAEDSLKQLLSDIKINNQNRIDINGNDTIAKNIHQKSNSGSNYIKIEGDRNFLDGITQE